MRLSKLSYHITIKTNSDKFESKQQQQQNYEYAAKCQSVFAKRFSGPNSIYSNGSGSGGRGSSSGGGSFGRNSGSGSGVATRNSIGNGSCISNTTTTTGSQNKKRKSKPTKCFNSTVFRCCLPCRGGGSAAPATSPPQSPVPTKDNEDIDKLTKSLIKKEDLIASDLPKKHSLADTIGTSVTTPISLKTLINDVDEDLEQPLTAADIAAAQLASGLLPRKAEPETLSDASVSPTAAATTVVLQATTIATLLTTTSATIVTTKLLPSTAKIATVSAAPPITTQSSPTSPTAAALVVFSQASNTPTVNPASVVAQPPTVSASSSRSCCPSQTSPLPHIQEEEESDQHSQVVVIDQDQGDLEVSQPLQQYDQLLPSSAATVSGVVYFGSSESVQHSSGTISSNTAANTPSAATSYQPDLTTTSTPSPRIKSKFRKPHKSCYTRVVLAPVAGLVANSSDTLVSITSGSTTNTSSAASATAHTHRLASSSASALASHPSNTQLLPAKMQAEQGSIGDLQKYHSRYLKNRRHTLANVR